MCGAQHIKLISKIHASREQKKAKRTKRQNIKKNLRIIKINGSKRIFLSSCGVSFHVRKITVFLFSFSDILIIEFNEKIYSYEEFFYYLYKCELLAKFLLSRWKERPLKSKGDKSHFALIRCFIFELWQM